MTVQELEALAKKLGCRSYEDVASVLRDATGDGTTEAAVRRWHKGDRALPGWVLYVLRHELRNNHDKPVMQPSAHGRPGAFDEQN